MANDTHRTRPPDIPAPAVTDDIGYLLKWFWVISLKKFVHLDNPTVEVLDEAATEINRHPHTLYKALDKENRTCAGVSWVRIRD